MRVLRAETKRIPASAWPKVFKCARVVSCRKVRVYGMVAMMTLHRASPMYSMQTGQQRSRERCGQTEIIYRSEEREREREKERQSWDDRDLDR